MAEEIRVDISFKLIENINRNVNNITKGITKLNKARISRLTSGFASFKSNIVALNQGIELTGRLIRGITGFFGKFIKAASKVEDLTTEFKILTGSVTNAQILIKDLVKFAAKTPFKLEGIAATARTLLAFQFSQDEIISRLKILGDIAAATNQPMLELGNVFAKIAAQGRLTGETLEQIQIRGINVGPAITKSFGVAEKEFRKLVSTGKVTFEVFDKAFTALTKKGAIFFDGTAQKAATLSGKISTLDDVVFQLFADIGGNLLPTIKRFVDASIEFIEKNKAELIKFSQSILRLMLKGFSGLLKVVSQVEDALSENTFNDVAKKIKALDQLLLVLERDLKRIAKEGGPKSVAKDLEEEIAKIKEAKKELEVKQGEKTIFQKASEDIDKLIENMSNIPNVISTTLEVKQKTEVQKSFFQSLDAGLRKVISKISNTSIKDVTGALAAGGPGARKFVSDASGAIADAFAPGSGKFVADMVQFLSASQEEFQQQINAFLDAMVDIPTRIAENVPFLIEAIIDKMPEIIDAWVAALPIIIVRLSELLADPKFWVKVAEAFLAQLTFGLIDSFEPLRKVLEPIADAFTTLFDGFQPLVDAFNGIVSAIEGLVDQIKNLGGGLLGGGGGGGLLGGLGGAAKSIASSFGFAEGGDVPNLSKYRNDKFPAMLSAGEPVLTKNTGDRLNQFLDRQDFQPAQGNTNLNLTLQVGEKELANVMVDLNQKGFRLT